jgi:tetratricopeptide (TPR) repeat protein
VPPRLFLNHDAEYGWLIALEFGLTDDGQPSENWAPVGEEIAYLVDGKRCVGFVVKNLEEFDPHDPDHEAIWQEPTFDVPALGLRGVTAGEIIVATNVFLDGESTVNRYLFDAAINAQRKPRKAVAIWRQCLQTGDVMAHYGLGYTLYELGNYHEAYGHLRAYTEITPSNAWAWCWFGKAAEAIGETAEAERAYRRALQLEEDGDNETDAAELLEQLIGGA